VHFPRHEGHLLAANFWSDTAPNWLTAIATVCALGAAYWAGRTAKRLYDKEHERDQRREDETRKEQASKVAAWASWADVPSAALRLLDGGVNRLNLAVRNDSATPVYDVRVSYLCNGQELGEQPFYLISPTGSNPSHREIKVDGVRELIAQRRRPGERLDIRVAIEFTDANGYHWHRDSAGQLTELPLPSARR
jgi:hypothetical protein